MDEQIFDLTHQVNRAKTLLWAESVLDRQPLIICYTAHLDHNQLNIAKDAGFDMVVEGRITKDLIEEILYVLNKRQKLFDDYAQLYEQYVDLDKIKIPYNFKA